MNFYKRSHIPSLVAKEVHKYETRNPRLLLKHQHYDRVGSLNIYDLYTRAN